MVEFLGVILKSNGNSGIIMDLSRPATKSVNDGIIIDHFPLSFRSAVKRLSAAGKGAFMAKADVQHTFRIVHVRPEDRHSLKYRSRG